VIAFYPVSAAIAVAGLRRPRVLAYAAAATGVLAAGAGIARGKPSADVRALALVTPVYAAAHALGMWSGALTLIRGRFRE
jgi:hypothetical protein